MTDRYILIIDQLFNGTAIGFIESFFRAIFAILYSVLAFILNDLLVRGLWDAFGLDQVFTDLVLKIPTEDDPYLFDVNIYQAVIDLYNTMAVYGYAILSFTLVLAGFTLLFESIKILPRTTSLQIIRRGVWAALFIMLMPYIWNLGGSLVNMFSLPGGVILPSMDDLKSVLFGRVSLSILLGNDTQQNLIQGDAGQAFGLLLLSLAMFFLMLFLILSIYILGLLKVFLTLFGFMVFPLVAALTIIPRIDRLVDRFVDILLGLLITPVFSAAALRVAYEFLLLRSSIPPGVIDPLIMYIGLITSVMMPILLVPFLGKFFEMVKSSVERGVLSAAMIVGPAVGAGVGMVAGGLAGGVGYLWTGVRSAGGAAGVLNAIQSVVRNPGATAAIAAGAGTALAKSSLAAGAANPAVAMAGMATVATSKLMSRLASNVKPRIRVGAKTARGFISAVFQGAKAGAKTGWSMGVNRRIGLDPFRVGYSAGKNVYATIEEGEITEAKGLVMEMYDAAIHESNLEGNAPPEVIAFRDAFIAYAKNQDQGNWVRLMNAFRGLGIDIRGRQAQALVASAIAKTPYENIEVVAGRVAKRLKMIVDQGGKDFARSFNPRYYQGLESLYKVMAGYGSRMDFAMARKAGYSVETLTNAFQSKSALENVINRSKVIDNIKSIYRPEADDPSSKLSLDEIRTAIVNTDPSSFSNILEKLEEEGQPVVSGEYEGEKLKEYILDYGDETTLRAFYKFVNEPSKFLEYYRQSQGGATALNEPNLERTGASGGAETPQTSGGEGGGGDQTPGSNVEGNNEGEGRSEGRR